MNNITVNDKLVRLAQEYQELGRLSQLSELQQNRLVKILNMAESALELSQMLNQIDCNLAEELNLLDEDSLGEYENQRAKLRECLAIQIPQDYRLSFLD